MVDIKDIGTPARECSFCHTPRDERAMMMVNPEQDCAICDVCVMALYPIVRMGYAEGSPYQKPDGKPN